MPNIFACQRFLTCVAHQKLLASEDGHWKNTTELESKFYYNFYKIDNMVQQPYWMFPLWRKNLHYHTAQHTHSQRLKYMYSFHSLLSITFPHRVTSRHCTVFWLSSCLSCNMEQFNKSYLSSLLRYGHWSVFVIIVVVSWIHGSCIYCEG